MVKASTTGGARAERFVVTAGEHPGWYTLRKIAAIADVDPRTVLKEVMEPGSVKHRAGDRIRQALSFSRAS